MRPKEAASPGMGRTLARILAGAFALVLLLSLASYHPMDAFLLDQSSTGGAIRNLCGHVGANLAGLLRTLAGVGAWLVPAYILWECFPAEGARWHRRIAWLALTLACWTALGAFGTRLWSDGSHSLELRWGGWLGSALWPPCRAALGPVGLPLLLGALAPTLVAAAAFLLL